MYCTARGSEVALLAESKGTCRVGRASPGVREAALGGLGSDLSSCKWSNGLFGNYLTARRVMWKIYSNFAEPC